MDRDCLLGYYSRGVGFEDLMDILFLDFDGVLNSVQDSIYFRRLGGDYGRKFSPLACSNVQWLLDQNPDLRIVVSSTWRVYNDIPSLKEILFGNGIDPEKVIDVTPMKDYPLLEGQARGSQIQRYLDLNSVSRYCIIDDDSDMLLSQWENFVKVSRLTGFMMGDALHAARILGIPTHDIDTNWF